MASQPSDKRGSAPSQSSPRRPEPEPRPATELVDSAPEPGLSATGEQGRQGRTRHTPYTGEGRPTREFARGERIDRYIVLNAVGQGGMGVVYAAYDPELDRKVALKLLRVEGQEVDPTEGRTRLLREAQAMARVSHPHVCSVFDVGTVDDQVFMAMELIEGPSLREWLKQKPRTWQEILRLFLEAGQGLAAAHAAGLVHRDFKPSNVLVGKDGRAHVTDFGLARKVTSAEAEEEDDSFKLEEVARHAGASALASFVTQVGVVTGTPQYMPPEQYLGNTPDARSDQFSFCAALYWALYRKRPFKPEKVAGAAQEISQRSFTPEVSSGRRGPTAGGVILEPPANVKVPGWLRRAVLRGLSLLPDERYPTMQELLDELSQEPRRAKRRWAAAGVAVTATLVGLTGMQLRRQAQVCAAANQPMMEVWNPEAKQKLEAAFAASGSPVGKELSQAVGHMLDAYALAWGQQATEACVATQVRKTQTEGLLSLRTVCLERRRKDVQALVRVLSEGNRKAVQRSLDAVSALPDLADCQDIEALSSEVSRPSDPAKRAEVEHLEALLADVDALSAAGLFDDALKNAKQLEPRVAATGFLPLEAELRADTGLFQDRLGDHDGAARLLEEAVNEAEAARADRLKIKTLTSLVAARGQQGRKELAEQWARLAESTIQRIGGSPLLSSFVKTNLGVAALTQGQFPEAKRYLEEARALQEKALPPTHILSIKLRSNLGVVAVQMGEYQRGAELLTEVVRQYQGLVGSKHPEVAVCHYYLAVAYGELGKLQESLEHAQDALAIRKVVFGEQSPQVAEVQDVVAISLMKLKRYDEARQLYEANVALKAKLLGPDNPDLAYSYDGIGQVLVAQGRFQEAIEPLEKALSFKDVEQDLTAASGFALAKALWESGGDRKRALDEASTARERFAKAGQKNRVTEVEEWLQSRAHEAVVPARHTRHAPR